VLQPGDDHPVHQTPAPLATRGGGDRNFYDRYFFNGWAPDGSLFFAAALGLYPNRRVMDAAFSVVSDGVQHSLHASRLAPRDALETRVGPIAVEVEAPLRRLRVRVDSPEHGFAADLCFHARTPAVEEPRFRRSFEGRTLMDLTRLTQWGGWEGSVAVGGRRHPVSPDATPGCRDRSWGVRPVGEREAGAPGPPPQFFWLWAPLHFEEFCTHFAVNEEADGRRWHSSGSRVALLAPGADPADATGVEPMDRVAHRVRLEPGTRRARSATLELVPHAGAPLAVELEPLLTFPMSGLGYLHPKWAHGTWQGELAVGAEQLILADLAPLDPRALHVQQLCRARLGPHAGTGVLEQLVIGPHAPSGLAGLLDGASG
jgi:hypothetical protein